MAGEEGLHPFDRVGMGGRILARDRHDALARRVGGQFAALEIGPIEVVIGTGIGVEFDRPAQSDGVVGQRLAGSGRRPDVFLALQDQERNRDRPVGANPLRIARAWIERHCGAEVGTLKAAGLPEPRASANRTAPPPFDQPIMPTLSLAT